jgi:hypothetical protein
MDEFFTNLVISDGVKVFMMFIVFLVLSHLLVFPFKQSKKTWKIIDYMWLGIAMLGLFPLASDVRIVTAESWVSAEEARAINSLERFREFYLSPERTHLCMIFVKSEFSPDDFEELQRQRTLSCDWSKAVAKVLLKINPKELPPLEIDDFPVPTFEEAYFLETVEDVELRVKWYNENRDKALKTITLLSKTEFEKTMFYLSPFLLCLALALRIAKVTNELIYEKV